MWSFPQHFTFTITYFLHNNLDIGVVTKVRLCQYLPFFVNFQAKRTKKVGITGKYGTRYGASLRKMVKKMEITQHSKYSCSFCGKVSVSVWPMFAVCSRLGRILGCHEEKLRWHLVVQKVQACCGRRCLGVLYDSCCFRAISCQASAGGQGTVNKLYRVI